MGRILKIPKYCFLNFILRKETVLIYYYIFAEDAYPRAPQVTFNPTVIDEDEYSVAEIRCAAAGNPAPEIEWQRIDGFMSADVVIREGFLRFNSLRKSDEGSYRCYARNNVGDHDQILQVYVRGQRIPVAEDVSVSPERHTGQPGEEIKLTCSSQPQGRTTWTKAGAVELPENVFVDGEELSIQYSTVDDSGRYVCNVQFPSGTTRSAYADVSIAARSNE